MSYIKGYRCTLCGAEFKEGEVGLTCPHCGEKGILDVVYDYDALKKVLTREYFENFKGERVSFDSGK